MQILFALFFLYQGQLVDALMTPVFGVLVDRYSKKKIWHVIGSILVTLSFPIIFGSFVDVSTPTAMFVYITSITIFQTGWAAVQISHLSMIPALTNSSLERADLTAIRWVYFANEEKRQYQPKADLTRFHRLTFYGLLSRSRVYPFREIVDKIYFILSSINSGGRASFFLLLRGFRCNFTCDTDTRLKLVQRLLSLSLPG